MAHKQRAVRITGDGVAWQGECVLKQVILNVDAGSDWVDIYDGLDATSGEKLLRMKSADIVTRSISLGEGVLFSVGIYLDGIDSAIETTVLFEPK